MIPPVLEKMPTTTKIKRPFPQGGPICLNLGGAGEGYISGKIPGFHIVDLRDVEETDIVSDISDLSFCKDGEVEKIYCSNALEHFSHIDTVKVLKEWLRVLKPGGKAYISVPDFDVVVKLYLKTGLTPWLKYHVWGDQAHTLNYHYVNFTFSSLADDCYKAGFSDIERVQSFPFGVPDASELRDTWTNTKISLNVVMTK